MEAPGIENCTDDELAGLAGAVTIIISVKDSYYTALDQLRAVIASAPGVPIVYVLSEPMNPRLKQDILSLCAQHPHITVLDSGQAFANHYELRNSALPLVASRYTLFLFNDIYPRDPDWLLNLYRAAETQPDADIFQPFIWEDGDVPHAAWDDLNFSRHADGLHAHHRFDTGFRAISDPARELEQAEQRYFLEDHAFLVRTDAVQDLLLLDPGASYTKEFIDMAMTARYAGLTIWSVPESQVTYASSYALGLDDILLFAYRRSEEMSLGSIAYICRKWDIRYWSGRIWDTFIDTQLANVDWSGDGQAVSVQQQYELLLAQFVAMGFNRFRIADAEAAGVVTADAQRLPAAWHTLNTFFQGDVCPSPPTLTPSFADEIPEFTAGSDDHAARQQALAQGRLFPVADAADADARVTSADPAYKTFYLVECRDMLLPPAQVEALRAHASLVLEQPRDDGLSRCRVFFYVRDHAQQGQQFQRLGHDLAQRLLARGKLRIGGRDYATGAVSLVDNRGAEMAPIILQDGERGWRIRHWGWKVYRYGELTALFEMYTLRRFAGGLLRKTWGSLRSGLVRIQRPATAKS